MELPPVPEHFFQVDEKGNAYYLEKFIWDRQYIFIQTAVEWNMVFKHKIFFANTRNPSRKDLYMSLDKSLCAKKFVHKSPVWLHYLFGNSEKKKPYQL